MTYIGSSQSEMPAWMGEGLTRPHPASRICWQLTATGEGWPFVFEGVATGGLRTLQWMRSYLCVYSSTDWMRWDRKRRYEAGRHLGGPGEAERRKWVDMRNIYTYIKENSF